jgi:hypothetical protein
MGGQHPLNSALRRIAPLVAVLVTVGPGAASAASPAPDAPPPGVTLGPDPVPRTTPTRAVSHVATAPARRVVEVATTPVQPPATVATPPSATKAAPTPPRRAAPPRHDSPVPAIVDVVPLRVDVHRGLGAIAARVRNDTQLALAAAALLVAVAAALSGAALAASTRRPA